MGGKLIHQAIASIPPGPPPQFGANAGNPHVSYTPPAGSGPGGNPVGGGSPATYVEGRTAVAAPMPIALRAPSNPKGFIKNFLDSQTVNPNQIYNLAAAITAAPPEQRDSNLPEKVSKVLGKYIFLEDTLEQALVNLAPVLYNPVSGEQMTPLGLLQECARHAMGKHEKFVNRTLLLMGYIHLAVKYAYLAGEHPERDQVTGQTQAPGLTRLLEVLEIPPVVSGSYQKQQTRRLQMLQVIRNGYSRWSEQELIHFWAAYERDHFPASDNPLS
jgi:hypothetical protein